MDTMTVSTSPSLASAAAQALSAEQQAQVRKLQASDTAVRQHEQAHLAAAKGLAQGGANFQLQKGPDGKQYAVGGEVSIDTSPGNTPEETLLKARIIQAAALAPVDPSGQDRAVAAAAQAMELQAQTEISLQSATEKKLAKQYQADELPKTLLSTTA